MKRFIFLTFGFMGWAFYEMSGGADFVPAGPQLAGSEAADSTLIASANAGTTSSSLVTAAAANAARKAESPITPFAQKAPARDDTATRVALNLTTLSDLPQANDAMVQKAVATPETRAGVKVVKAKTVNASASMVQNASYSVTTSSTPVVIPSLINSGDNSATYVSTTQADIRKVSGTRVNVRGGPGTNFGVVGRLGKGDAVEIIEDNGAGWVRFRSVDGAESGWMADFLLSNG
jgi:hypothetical protein